MATGKDLRKALRIIGLTMEEAAEKLQISRGTLYNYVNREELDAEFEQTVQKVLNIDLENLTTRPYLEQRRDHKNNDSPYMVSFVDIPAQAGYSKAYDHIDYIQTLKKFPILPDVDPTGAIWRYFQIDGDSMEPEFLKGDVILCSQVPKDDWTQFRDYHTYVIVTDKDLWIKDVYKLSEEEWILLSQNQSYQPFKINVQDIRQLWVMRRHIKNRAKKHVLYDMDKIIKKLK